MKTQVNDEPENDSWTFYFQSYFSPDIIKRLFKLSRKLRATTNLKEKFIAIAGSLPCSESPTRWNSTFYALQDFLEHIDGYKQFSELFNNVNDKDTFKFNCSENDVIIAKIFYEILTPFEALTKLLSQNTPLSICKLPLMFYIRDIMEISRKQLEKYLKRGIYFEKFDKKFNKYLRFNLKGNYITYLACLFFVDSDVVIENAKENSIDWLKSLTDLSFQLLNCEFKGRNGLQNCKSSGALYVEHICGANSFQLENECMNRAETSNTIRSIPKSTIKKDLGIFYTFQQEKMEGVTQSIQEDMKLTLNTFVDHNGRLKFKKSSPTSENLLLSGVNYKTEQIFIAKYNISLKLIIMYLDEVKGNKIEGRILPVLLEYLLSINITSVSSERNFSKLKRIFGTDRHSLNNQSAFNELLIKQIMTVFHVDCSFNSIKEEGMTGLLSNAI